MPLLPILLDKDFSKLNLRRWALLTFAIACIVINVAAFVLYQKNQQLNNSKEWVSHTYEVIHTTDSFLFQAQDMQIALRGYLLTGNKNFLKPYYQTLKDIGPLEERLMRLTRDNPVRQQQLTDLDHLFTEQKKLMANQIARRQRGLSVSDSDMIKSKELMDRVRGYNAIILDGEQDLLIKRATAERKQHSNYMRAVFGTAGIAIIGMLFANGIIAFLTIRRKSAEDHLRRINKEMEGFTYIASHDLRSPLVNLKGFSSEMRHGINELRLIIEPLMTHAQPDDQKKIAELLDKDIPDALHYIHSSVEKMDKLTNAILELSRLGRRQLKLEMIDTNKLVRRILDTFQHQITDKGIAVKSHPMPLVNADPLSLEQVFSNVIDNAIKYLDPQRPGKIEIGAQRTHRVTTFWVKDNGRGVSKADQEKIFEIYRRGGGHRDIPGEGMGMAYVRTTLRRMGGMIWCESVPDVGSIFYFTISNTLQKETSND